jgi:excisionase family DNA binding protein
MATEREAPITIKQACALVGVSRRTIYNWMAKGRLDCVRTAGGNIRIYADSLYQSRTPTPDGSVEKGCQ